MSGESSVSRLLTKGSRTLGRVRQTSGSGTGRPSRSRRACTAGGRRRSWPRPGGTCERRLGCVPHRARACRIDVAAPRRRASLRVPIAYTPVQPRSSTPSPTAAGISSTRSTAVPTAGPRCRRRWAYTRSRSRPTSSSPNADAYSATQYSSIPSPSVTSPVSSRACVCVMTRGVSATRTSVGSSISYTAGLECIVEPGGEHGGAHQEAGRQVADLDRSPRRGRYASRGRRGRRRRGAPSCSGGTGYSREARMTHPSTSCTVVAAVALRAELVDEADRLGARTGHRRTRYRRPQDQFGGGLPGVPAMVHRCPRLTSTNA